MARLMTLVMVFSCGIAIGTASWTEDMLKKENDNRAKHGSPPLKYNDELARRSQKWADHLADGCQPLKVESHMPRDKSHPDAYYKDGILGENIWTAQKTVHTHPGQVHVHFEKVKKSKRSAADPFAETMAPKAADAWYGEIRLYPWNTNYHGQAVAGGEVGHFTQMVWEKSEEVGYGLGTKEDCDRFYVVARYYPTGNVNTAEEYNANVKPKKD